MSSFSPVLAIFNAVPDISCLFLRVGERLKAELSDALGS
jgi:hypothetical protein